MKFKSTKVSHARIILKTNGMDSILKNKDDAICAHCLEPLSSTELSENAANPDLREPPLDRFKPISEEKFIVISCCNKTS